MIAAIKRGEMIILVDDEARENEGDLITGGKFCHAGGRQFYGRTRSRVGLSDFDG